MKSRHLLRLRSGFTLSCGFALAVSFAAAQDVPLPRPDRLAPDHLSASPGEFSFGIYYGEADNVTGTVGLTLDRALGTDERLDFGASVGTYASSLSLLVTDPDFFEGPYARQLSLAIRTVEPNAAQAGDYSYTQIEGGIGFGRRLSPSLAYSFGAGLAAYKIDNVTALPDYIAEYIDAVGDDFQDGFVYTTLDWDLTDTLDWRRTGVASDVTLQLGVAGDRTTYGTLSAGVSAYRPVFQQTELRLFGAVQMGDTFDDGPYPIFRTFVGGGPGTVRGFGEWTLGPTSDVEGSSDETYPGGQFAVFGGLEAKTPLMGRDDLFGLAYFDVGNVYETAQDFAADTLRSSVGIGVQWETDIGPLSLYLSEPLNPEDGDEIRNVQFLLGIRL